MAHETIQRVSVPNFEVFGPLKIDLWAKEVGEFFIILMEKWAGGRSFAHRNGCHNRNV